MKISRRTILASALPALAAAQTAPPAPAPAPESAPDYLAISAAQYQRSAAAMAKVAVPMTTEPAFAFKA
ncbi:MAG: hypothetical protein M3Z09_09240 [Acidobacteriota bacterium]|nr:hypothetical protein [Acidobacteriota bacterium]